MSNMSLLSRGTRAAVRPISKPVARQTQRSASSQPHGSHGHSGESAFHVTGGSASGNESFGKGLYLSLAFIPTAYLAYLLSSSDNNFINKSYQNYKNSKHSQDVLHTTALEQAISDRSAVLKEPRGTTRDIRFPEMFNVGSPWNVVAGEGTADMRKLEAFYHEQRKQMEEAREARMGKKA